MRWTLVVRYETLSADLFTHNRQNLRGLLKPNSIVIIHANDIYPTNADGTLGFKQNSDLFYLTGVDQEETVLVMMPDAGDPKEREILFVKETSELIAIWEGQKLTKEQAAAVSGVDRIEWAHTFDSFIHRWVGQMDHIYPVRSTATNGSRPCSIACASSNIPRKSACCNMPATSPKPASAACSDSSNQGSANGKSKRN